MIITIIGCGHGGQALAVDLIQKGCEINLYAHPDHPGGLHAIANAKGIESKGLIQGFFPVKLATTNLQLAVEDSQYIFIVLPSYVHEAAFIELLPFLKSGQTVITLAANFASLSYLKLLEKTNNKKGIDLIDVASLPYVCRADNLGIVEIIAIKNRIAVASVPASAVQKHLHALKQLISCELNIYSDVLSLGMNITSGLTHPAVTLLNAGRIGKETFYFYKDGITPEIAHVIERLDEERLQIGQRLKLEMFSYLDIMESYYGVRYHSVYQFYRESSAHNALHLCPSSLKERYITQDVGGLLVPWYGLSKLAQCETIVLNNLISLASLLNNTNYFRTGTNLVRLNLHDKTIEEMKQYVTTGEHTSGFSFINDHYHFDRNVAGGV